MHPPTPKAEHLSPESGAPMADLQPQTPKAEHLSPEKHEGMRMVGQTAALKEALVGAMTSMIAPGAMFLPLIKKIQTQLIILYI
jgi:hypothetical protein